MDLLASSWNSISTSRATGYLRTGGSEVSKRILADLLQGLGRAPLSVLELGCGNGQVYGYLKSQGLKLKYTGVDISDPLLGVARAEHPEAQFIKDDVGVLAHLSERFDVVYYSHVIEMLPSPEQSLLRARQLADRIMIRFYEPPVFDFDTVELTEMDAGEGRKVPCLRRRMSRDYYRLILTKMGCESVDVYKDPTSKDQVHVLRY